MYKAGLFSPNHPFSFFGTNFRGPNYTLGTTSESGHLGSVTETDKYSSSLVPENAFRISEKY